MKVPTDHQQPDQPLQPAGRNRIKRRGVALILVVSFVVLLTALVVSFFSRVSSELGGARSYAEGVNSRQLADSAVGVVMGQIRAATTVKNGCWASQPGMIRVYGSAGGQPSAQAYAFYKLYSSHNLVVSGTDIQQFDPSLTNPSSGAQAEVPIGNGGWLNQPAFFTDLNEPVDVPGTTAGGGTVKRYPIMDPSVARIAALNQNTANNITNWVEGCEITLPQGDDLKKNNAPMPVRWLYVLRDGTLSAPTPLTGPAAGNTGLQATWTAVGPTGTATGVPTKDNPIVGRIAFWTDDDTCKVNVNTAGGYLLPDGVTEDKNLDNSKPSGNRPETNPAFYAGSFWDTPRVQTVFDRGLNINDATRFVGGLANSQPIQNEFQRYPGHPSTTSLGLVLKNLLPSSTTGFVSSKLYQMTPRLSYRGKRTDGSYHNGSEGGTKRLEPNVDQPVTNIALDPNDPLNNLLKATAGDLPMLKKAGYTSPAIPTTDTKTDSDPYHLLGSVDELFYTALIDKSQKSGSARQKAETVIGIKPNSITPTMVDQARFFLTAHSRSPELNLFGRPRVTIWPVSSAKSEGTLIGVGIRNLSDDMLRFCSTVGATINWADNSDSQGRPGQFIFDREDPYSSTSDFNRQRNKEVFAYLRDITSNTNGRIPGFGSSFEAKYSAGPGGRDQILTEIYDYIRSVNLKDTSRDRAIEEKYGKSTDPNSQTVKMKLLARYAMRGIIVPTRIKATATSGFGRFPTISEASLVFYHGGYLYRKKRAKPSDPLNAEDVEYNWSQIPRFDQPENGWSKANDLTGIIVRAFLVFETFNPMQGYGPVTDFSTSGTARENIVYEITNLSDFQIRTKKEGFQSLKMGKGENHVWRSSGSTYGGRNFGGTEGFFHTLQDKTSNIAGVQPYPWSGGQTMTYEAAGSLGTPLTIAAFTSAYYPFQTPCRLKMDGVRVQIGDPDSGLDGVNVNIAQETFDFSGGTMDVTIRYVDLAQNGLPPHNELTQTIKLNWPAGTAWPLPITERDTPNGTKGQAFRQVTGGFDRTAPGWNADNAPTFAPNSGIGGNNWTGSGGYRMSAHLPLRIAWCALPDYNPFTIYDTTTGVQTGGDGKNYAGRYLNILQPGDTIRSMIPGGTNAAGTDPRAAHLQQTVTTFAAHPDYNKANTRRAQTLRFGSGGFYFDPTDNNIFPGEGSQPTTGSLVALGSTRYAGGSGPDLPKNNGNPVIAKRFDGQAADFDTGIGNFPDGPYCGKADEGNIVQVWYDRTKKPGSPGWQNWVEPYFSTWVYNAPLDTYFSPNRQLPSPVMFGSLLAPQAPWDKAGWKTLLFCPNPAGDNHPGAQTPPDHLLLDLFNMPVVEPYAISEPFSTDGKVNLNYQLMPFSFIKRSTALRAALHPLRVTAIPNSLTRVSGGATELCYKTTNQQGQNNPENLRYLIDRDETVKAIDAFFDEYKGNRNGGFFKSASQICERYLYPKGQPNKYNSTVTFQSGEAPIKNWWKTCTVTGDNVREKPYSDLYSRVTTKSNTYTVHYRVQSLRQRAYTGNAAGEAAYYRTWDESRDQVLSEFRGHTTIERFLDPVDPRLDPNPNSTSTTKINVHKQSLEEVYRFRVVYNKRFSPW